MYIALSKGDLYIHGVIIAAAANFYNPLFRFNELMT